MAEAFNPYGAPTPSVGDDFIAVEPRRRPAINRFAAAVSFATATFLLALEGFAGFLMITMPTANPPPLLSERGLMFIPLACSPVAFLVAGHSFWGLRDRRGVILFLVALGFFLSIFLVPMLLPSTSVSVRL